MSERVRAAASVRPTLDLERQLANAAHDAADVAADACRTLIIGCDEVGRGALAGPLMVGAMAIDGDHMPESIPQYLRDSKLVTPLRRAKLAPQLREWGVAWSVGAASNREIDARGVSWALGVAAVRAIAAVERAVISGMPHISFEAQPRFQRVVVVLDGSYDYISPVLTGDINAGDVPQLPMMPEVVTKVKADQSSALVAAASVLAKVTRDELMVKLAERSDYARYDWQHNKGYGSAKHRNAIAQYGSCDLHRLSWHLQKEHSDVAHGDVAHDAALELAYENQQENQQKNQQMGGSSAQ